MHLTMVWDGTSTLSLYKNGVLKATDVEPLTVSTENPIRFGTGGATPTRYFDGKLDDVKLYNYALTPQQILINYNSGAVRFE